MLLLHRPVITLASILNTCPIHAVLMVFIVFRRFKDIKSFIEERRVIHAPRRTSPGAPGSHGYSPYAGHSHTISPTSHATSPGSVGTPRPSSQERIHPIDPQAAMYHQQLMQHPPQQTLMIPEVWRR